MKRHGKRIFAHRGLNRICPENTLSAFRACAERNVKWIETDVDILGDGTVILCHDTTLDRTTNYSGGYYHLTAKDLPQIDAGSWFSPEFTGEPLPRLSQLIDLLNENKLNVNIEIKSNEAGRKMSLLLLNNVLAELERLAPQRKVIVSSFNHLLLDRLKSKAPKLPVGCLYSAKTLRNDWRSVLELVGAEYIHPQDSALTRERVKSFKDAGFGVNVWTVNSADRANELFNWGVDGIFTDIADELSRRSR